MATAVRMPRMGANMEEGTILRWLKQVGDSIDKDEPLLEIETDKVTVEVPAPAAGTLIQVTAQEGASVAVGTVIGSIGAAGETVAAAPRQVAGTAPQASGQTASHIAEQEAAEAPEDATGRIRSSPLARKVARELGVDLSTLKGSGPSGRIVRADVEQAAQTPTAAAPSAPSPTRAAPKPVTQGASRIRRVTAERMHESLANTAQLTLTMDADVTRADELRHELRAELGPDAPPISLMPFVMKAVTKALQIEPAMYQRWDEQGLHPAAGMHLGIAVALAEGLMVPVMRDVDQASIVQIATWIKEVGDRVRTGQVQLSELSGASFSISNLGAYPVGYFTPILNTGEPGLLGLGRAQKRPMVVKDDRIEVRLVLPMSLTWDHRVLDGAPAAHFAAVVKDFLEHPLRLIAD